MNIFCLDEDPVLAANYSCNAHCVKMCVENLQLLATSVILNGVSEDKLPLTKSGTIVKKTHENHPSAIWSRSTRSNYQWLAKHAKAMCQEYTFRYGKNHFCEKAIDQLSSLDYLIPEGELQPFSIAISQDSECRKNPNFESMSPVEKYREYYRKDKAKIAIWGRGREKPNWY